MSISVVRADDNAGFRQFCNDAGERLAAGHVLVQITKIGAQLLQMRLLIEDLQTIKQRWQPECQQQRHRRQCEQQQDQQDVGA